jgi:hypothetical protein
MGHESQIELWSPNLTTFCFAGFGTERLRREEAMKTADSENPNRGVAWPRNRAYGAVGQNQSRSIEWAEKQEKFRPKEMCFFLTSPFIELIGRLPSNPGVSSPSSHLSFANGDEESEPVFEKKPTRDLEALFHLSRKISSNLYYHGQVAPS